MSMSESQPKRTRLKNADYRRIREELAEGVAPDVLAVKYGRTVEMITALSPREGRAPAGGRTNRRPVPALPTGVTPGLKARLLRFAVAALLDGSTIPQEERDELVTLINADMRKSYINLLGAGMPDADGDGSVTY